MFRYILLLACFLLLPTAAQAQRPCQHATAFQHIAPTGPIEAVPGQPGQRVYFCGFMVAQKGNTLDLRIWAADPGCAGNLLDLSPQWSFPNDFAIVNRLENVGINSPLGASLCFQTFGTGGLTGMLYWEQF